MPPWRRAPGGRSPNRRLDPSPRRRSVRRALSIAASRSFARILVFQGLCQILTRKGGISLENVKTVAGTWAYNTKTVEVQTCKFSPSPKLGHAPRIVGRLIIRQAAQPTLPKFHLNHQHSKLIFAHPFNHLTPTHPPLRPFQLSKPFPHSHFPYPITRKFSYFCTPYTNIRQRLYSAAGISKNLMTKYIFVTGGVTLDLLERVRDTTARFPDVGAFEKN